MLLRRHWLDAALKDAAPGHYLQPMISDKNPDYEIVELIYNSHGDNGCC